ncbi:hypothetical protein [Polaromonas sp. JS666]|uniref:hypothetical protein n=1 Tax=Polaromonas sp. (strain JS666 / ATCC BAA-500) TaxID=296591 RepID=UPI0000464B4E|nr:hypothetical protein [Polaromonas sp. JS666]ABE45659.1 hypothetical protein Bpro_3760 [Polaromonas sp. JS666]
MTDAQRPAEASMKKTIKVTIEKVIEIELTPAMFGGMTEAEYIAQFKQGLWHIDGLDDIYTYAARMAAHHGGGIAHDGLGLLSAHYSTHPRVPDVKFRIVDEFTEEEIQ